MGINNKHHSKKMTCTIITCGRQSEHKLYSTAYNKSIYKFMCSQCYIAYCLGKQHQLNKTRMEKIPYFKVQ